MAQRTAITRLGKIIDLGSAIVPDGDGYRGNVRLVALLLEDESLISMDVETTLFDAGFDVHCAMSCKGALDWLDLHRPAVVIVDIILRDGRCTEVVSRLLTAGIPFIVHSGDQRSAQVGTPFEFGAWVSKPSDSNALVQAANAATTIQSGSANSLSAGELLKL